MPEKARKLAFQFGFVSVLNRQSNSFSILNHFTIETPGFPGPSFPVNTQLASLSSLPNAEFRHLARTLLNENVEHEVIRAKNSPIAASEGMNGMQNFDNTYFSYLTKSMAELFDDVLKADGMTLFKKSPRVVFNSALSPSSSDFHLYITGIKNLKSEVGTLTFPLDQDTFIVFRRPSGMMTSFLICGNNLSAEQKLRAYDRIMTFFFNNRSLKPFVPESYKAYPQLYSLLTSLKAELKMSDNPVANSQSLGNGSPLDSFSFSFNYTALYHSGRPLREDPKITQRVVDCFKNNEERSVL